jgi:hypothetical protein
MTAAMEIHCYLGINQNVMTRIMHDIIVETSWTEFI